MWGQPTADYKGGPGTPVNRSYLIGTDNIALSTAPRKASQSGNIYTARQYWHFKGRLYRAHWRGNANAGQETKQWLACRTCRLLRCPSSPHGLLKSNKHSCPPRNFPPYNSSISSLPSLRLGGLWQPSACFTSATNQGLAEACWRRHP